MLKIKPMARYCVVNAHRLERPSGSNNQPNAARNGCHNQLTTKCSANRLTSTNANLAGRMTS